MSGFNNSIREKMSKSNSPQISTRTTRVFTALSPGADDVYQIHVEVDGSGWDITCTKDDIPRKMRGLVDFATSVYEKEKSLCASQVEATKTLRELQNEKLEEFWKEQNKAFLKFSKK